MNIESKTFHLYECRTGCGTLTLMDFKFPNRKPRCPRCGTNFTMEYKGLFKAQKKSMIELGLKEDKNEN